MQKLEVLYKYKKFVSVVVRQWGILGFTIFFFSKYKEQRGSKSVWILVSKENTYLWEKKIDAVRKENK